MDCNIPEEERLLESVLVMQLATIFLIIFLDSSFVSSYLMSTWISIWLMSYFAWLLSGVRDELFVGFFLCFFLVFFFCVSFFTLPPFLLCSLDSISSCYI